MTKNFTKFMPLGVYLLFGILLFFAFWIRIKGVDAIPEGQLTGTDAYLYYWQAQLISEQGTLPERDMHRWLPLGRDLGQTLNLYSYVLAYIYKVLAWVFPTVTLYHVTLYMPTLCFCIGLGVLCLFLYRAFGCLFSSVSGVLLATFPGTIDRSTAGFSDRDSWCLLLGILAVVTYLAALQTQHTHKKRLWILASGFTVFLGGLSWEGFGVFLSVILVVELWRFLTSENESGLGRYALWVCCFVPTLYLASPAYRNGYGFAQHLFAFMLVPPVVLLGIRTLRHLLLSEHARTLALGFTLGIIALALYSVFIQRDTFAHTTVISSQNRLMRTIGELKTPDYHYWVFRYGSCFFIGSLGLINISTHLWKKWGAVFGVPLSAFILTTFFQGKIIDTLGTAASNHLFSASIVGSGIGVLILGWRRNDTQKTEVCYIAALAWFLLWGTLARGAVRYDFFIGVPIAFFTATLIRFLLDAVCMTLNAFYRTQRVIKTGLTVCCLALLMYWTPAGAHAKRAIFVSTQMRTANPGNSLMAEAFGWMKAELPSTAVVAAHWHYGSQLNVLAGVKTITDQDHYIQLWIYLYERHVYHAANEREVLEYLKTHGATHLVLTPSEPIYTLLRRPLSRAFLPVYPTEDFETAPVKIWEIHYPPDIQADPKYLRTGIPEIDDTFPFHATGSQRRTQ